MKASIVEITEWYNSKGELIEQTIVYETGRKCGCFEQLPKTAEKVDERSKMHRGIKSRQMDKKGIQKGAVTMKAKTDILNRKRNGLQCRPCCQLEIKSNKEAEEMGH